MQFRSNPEKYVPDPADHSGPHPTACMTYCRHLQITQSRDLCLSRMTQMMPLIVISSVRRVYVFGRSFWVQNNAHPCKISDTAELLYYAGDSYMSCCYFSQELCTGGVTCRGSDRATVDRTRPDPTRPDPTRPDPTQPDPTRPNPTRPDPTRPDPTQPDPTRPDPTRPVRPWRFENVVTRPDPTCEISITS